MLQVLLNVNKNNLSSTLLMEHQHHPQHQHHQHHHQHSASSMVNNDGDHHHHHHQHGGMREDLKTTSTCPESTSHSTSSPTNSGKSSQGMGSFLGSLLGFGDKQDVNNTISEIISSSGSPEREWIAYWKNFMDRVEIEYKCQDVNIDRACELVQQQVPVLETKIDTLFDEMFRKLEDCKCEMKKSVHNFSDKMLVQLTKLKDVKSEWNGWLEEKEPIYMNLSLIRDKINMLQDALKDMPDIKQVHEFDLIGMDAEIDWFLDSVRVDHYKESPNDHSILQTDQKFWDQLSRSKFRDMCEQDELYQLQMGLKNIKSNRISRAVHWLELSSKQGNSIAQYQLGCLYQTGKGVKQDMVVAKEWFEKSSEKNNADAQNDLGCIYSNGLTGEQNHEKAKELFEKSAIQGHALAQKNLGGLYLNGMGVDQDYERAKEWLEKSACQGNSDAQYYLACLYYYGYAEETSDDSDTKAIQWFEKSAAQGNEAAKEKLAEMLEEMTFDLI